MKKMCVSLKAEGFGFFSQTSTNINQLGGFAFPNIFESGYFLQEFVLG